MSLSFRCIYSVILALCVLSSPILCIASHLVIKITDPDNIPVADAVTIASCDSTTSISYSDEKGEVKLSDKHVPPIDIEIQAVGFKSKTIRIINQSISVMEVRLDHSDESILNEIIVTGDRSNVVKRLANGQRFFLSNAARDMKNPYMALIEIPSLISDPFNSTIKTTAGESPLILVDGEEINSGISPISPSDIEYVDVIDVIPAKFLSRGVKSMINIKLRKKRPAYIWSEFATRHEVPLHKGFGVGYFEIGNEKFSLYTRASANYTHDSDSEGYVNQYNDGYSLDYDWSRRANAHNALGELILKWAPSKNDRIAIQAHGVYNDTRSERNGDGIYNDGTAQDYLTKSYDHDRSSIFTASAYYKRLFADQSELIATIQYNHNNNLLIADGGESFGLSEYLINTRFNNTRNSGSVDITYDKDFGSKTHFTAGSTTTLLFDRISTLDQPLFHHSNSDEYLYMTLSSKCGPIMWLLSPGLQATWIKAADSRNKYIRARGSASATWNINRNNSLQLKYELTNKSPDASQFNPFNTSTDSLTMSIGNPDLTPQIEQDACLQYTFNKGSLYASACSGILMYSDMITPWGYNDNSDVYVNTYRNYGHFKTLYSWISINYNLTSGKFRSNINANATWERNLFMHHRPKDSYSLYVYLNAWFRKFYFGGGLNLKPRIYTDISSTRNLRPVYADFQINYSITDDLYVAFCLQGYTGNQKMKVLTQNGTFKSISTTKFKETGFHPWILIRWTIRKHPERKIDMGKVIDVKEQGIKLK